MRLVLSSNAMLNKGGPPIECHVKQWFYVIHQATHRVVHLYETTISPIIWPVFYSFFTPVHIIKTCWCPRFQPPGFAQEYCLNEFVQLQNGDSDYSHTFNVVLPDDFVEDSKRVEVIVTGETENICLQGRCYLVYILAAGQSISELIDHSVNWSVHESSNR